jgi:hypothetical protein
MVNPPNNDKRAEYVRVVPPTALEATIEKVIQYPKTICVAAAGAAVCLVALGAPGTMTDIGCFVWSQLLNGVGLATMQSSFMPSWCDCSYPLI